MSGNLFETAGREAGRESFSAWCDGGSRGNPGPSGYGAVIQDPEGRTVARLSRYLGIQTNNYAEYHGLLAVLDWAIENGVDRLRVISDSELMVKQMKGQYKVASPVLRPLWEEAKRRAARLGRFEIAHTLRGGNKEADRLANEAMDTGMKKPATRPAGSPASPPVSGAASQPRNEPMQPPKPPRLVLEGYVKNGVIHLLGGELPEGSFVKITRE